MDIIKEHSTSPEKLGNMLRELYPFLEDRNIKTRFTKVINIIEKLEDSADNNPDQEV